MLQIAYLKQQKQEHYILNIICKTKNTSEIISGKTNNQIIMDNINQHINNCILKGILSQEFANPNINFYNSLEEIDTTIVPTKKWNINLIDVFPLNQNDFDRYIMNTNVPFIGTAGINFLIDCIFKYGKIPISELYGHHTGFIREFISKSEFPEFNTYLDNMLRLCPPRQKGSQVIKLPMCDCSHFQQTFIKMVHIILPDLETFNSKMETLHRLFNTRHNLKNNILIKLTEHKKKGIDAIINEDDLEETRIIMANSPSSKK